MNYKSLITYTQNFPKDDPINLHLACATGDDLINFSELHVDDVVDMEAYALAKVCVKYEIPFNSFKYISGGSDTDADIDLKNINNGENLFKSIVLDHLGVT
tara:strand:- start:210 stop:512 length:303 start_codon:yes stop_codon:yes gene_type:complete